MTGTAETEEAEFILEPEPVITVGDVVTLTLLEMGIVPDLSIVDYQTQRGSDEELGEELIGSFLY